KTANWKSPCLMIWGCVCFRGHLDGCSSSALYVSRKVLFSPHAGTRFFCRTHTLDIKPLSLCKSDIQTSLLTIFTAESTVPMPGCRKYSTPAMREIPDFLRSRATVLYQRT